MVKRMTSERISAFASSARSQKVLARSKPNFFSSQITSRRRPEWICPPFRPDAPLAIAVRLDQHDIGAGLGEMQRRGQAGEAAADDADIGLREPSSGGYSERRLPRAEVDGGASRCGPSRGGCSR